jgi:hypothetical protein
MVSVDMWKVETAVARVYPQPVLDDVVIVAV